VHAALIDRLTQRLAGTEEMFLAKETVERFRANTVRQRTIRVVAGTVVRQVLCEEISQS